jgi:hypothetical protein
VPPPASKIGNGFQLAHELVQALLGSGLLAALGQWAQHTRWWLLTLWRRR